MVLAKGITGFCNEDMLNTVEEIDAKAFRAACYEVALERGVTLVNIVECEYPFTYHKAIFDVDGERIQLLVNIYYGIGGFVKSSDPIQFCDIPSVLSTIGKHYKLLTEDELLTYPSSEELAKLDSEELKQLDYWKPRNQGEIIFNYWD